jgi:hypothetical protein
VVAVLHTGVKHITSNVIYDDNVLLMKSFALRPVVPIRGRAHSRMLLLLLLRPAVYEIRKSGTRNG